MQVDYLDWIAGQCKDINSEILMYSFLHDIPSNMELFNKIALEQNDGTPKAAYFQWKTLAERPYRRASN